MIGVVAVDPVCYAECLDQCMDFAEACEKECYWRCRESLRVVTFKIEPWFLELVDGLAAGLGLDRTGVIKWALAELLLKHGGDGYSKALSRYILKETLAGTRNGSRFQRLP